MGAWDFAWLRQFGPFTAQVHGCRGLASDPKRMQGRAELLLSPIIRAAQQHRPTKGIITTSRTPEPQPGMQNLHFFLFTRHDIS